MTVEKSHILPAKFTKSDIRRRYRGLASRYDFWGIVTESKARDVCLELAGIQDGDDVLEVAVGTGIAFREILQRNPNGRNEGIDLTPEMLARAEKKAAETGSNNYRLRIGDAYELDFDDNRFDVLINNYMFDLLPEADFPQVLGEFKRVLRPDGRLVLANMSAAGRWYNGLWQSVYRLRPTWMGGCRGVSLPEHMEAVGFSHIKKEFVSQMTFPSEVVYGQK